MFCLVFSLYLGKKFKKGALFDHYSFLRVLSSCAPSIKDIKLWSMKRTSLFKFGVLLTVCHYWNCRACLTNAFSYTLDFVLWRMETSFCCGKLSVDWHLYKTWLHISIVKNAEWDNCCLFSSWKIAITFAYWNACLIEAWLWLPSSESWGLYIWYDLSLVVTHWQRTYCRWGDPGHLFGMVRVLPMQTGWLLPLLSHALWENKGDMRARVWMLNLRANGKYQSNVKQTQAKQVKSSHTISVMSSCFSFSAVSLCPLESLSG